MVIIIIMVNEDVIQMTRNMCPCLRLPRMSLAGAAAIAIRCAMLTVNWARGAWDRSI